MYLNLRYQKKKQEDIFSFVFGSSKPLPRFLLTLIKAALIIAFRRFLYFICVCVCTWAFWSLQMVFPHLSIMASQEFFFYCFGLDFVWKVRPARTGDYCSTQGMGEMYFWKQMAAWRGFSSRGAENKCTRLLRLPEIRCTYNSTFAA